jgi:hypothetical protein
VGRVSMLQWRDSLWPRVGLLLAMTLTVVLTGVAGAAPPPQGAAGAGSVVALRGTPHLWIADAQGVFHWAGDTRALAGKPVDWGSRREIGLDEVRALRRGDPWLSAGLVKLGDPIYFVKWETDAASPTLLHIQSIGDVELFGINATNYGTYVLDQGAWEARFSLATAGLARGVLAPATGAAGSGSPAAPPPAATATPTAAPQGSILPSGFDPQQYIGKGDAYNCNAFQSQAEAQAVLRADPRDPNRLDTDRDGIACENNPAPRDSTPVPR